MTGGGGRHEGNDDAPDRRGLPSIAVLPYFCIKHGTVDTEFGKAITFMLTEALKAFADLHVISASSTLQFAAKAPRARQIAGQLNVRYVLGGSVTQSDQMLTITSRLHDIEKGRPLVFKSIDVPIGHLHDTSHTIAGRVVAAILPSMNEAEIQRALTKPPHNLTAYELVLKAIVALHTLTRGSVDRAEKQLLEAQVLDPDNAAAFAWHARVWSIRVGQGWVRDRQLAAQEALRLAAHAVAVDDRHALALATAGYMHVFVRHDFETGMPLLDRAREVGPNEPFAWLLSGAALSFRGKSAEGRSMAEYALCLTPFDGCAYMFHSFLSGCCYGCRDYEAALRHARIAAAANPNYTSIHRQLAAAYAALGRIAEAREAAAEVLRQEPDYPELAEAIVPIQDPVARELYLTHLRTAGVLPPKRRRPPQAAE